MFDLKVAKNKKKVRKKWKLVFCLFFVVIVIIMIAVTAQSFADYHQEIEEAFQEKQMELEEAKAKIREMENGTNKALQEEKEGDDGEAFWLDYFTYKKNASASYPESYDISVEGLTEGLLNALMNYEEADFVDNIGSFLHDNGIKGETVSLICDVPIGISNAVAMTANVNREPGNRVTIIYFYEVGRYLFILDGAKDSESAGAGENADSGESETATTALSQTEANEPAYNEAALSINDIPNKLLSFFNDTADLRTTLCQFLYHHNLSDVTTTNIAYDYEIKGEEAVFTVHLEGRNEVITGAYKKSNNSYTYVIGK